MVVLRTTRLRRNDERSRRVSAVAVGAGRWRVTLVKEGRVPDTTVTSADGTKLAARCSGEGTPMVLVHGANGDLDSFALIEGLYGDETDAAIYATPGEVAEFFPKAQLHGLRGQRHLAFAFDPTSFAQAILAFTTAHDG